MESIIHTNALHIETLIDIYIHRYIHNKAPFLSIINCPDDADSMQLLLYLYISLIILRTPTTS